MVPDVDETPLAGEAPGAMVTRLAVAKVSAVTSGQAGGTIVIGADTTVELDGRIIGKPSDKADAGRILAMLSGRTHHVHTAVAVGVAGGAMEGGSTCTEVQFAALEPAVIEWYVDTGEPMDKAGAYGLQGLGSILVSSVTGSVSGVLGLPLDVVAALLTAVR